MKRKALDTKKYVAVLVITLAIFSVGILVGHTLSSQKVSLVNTLQEDLRSEALDMEIAFTLLEQEPCAFVDTAPVVAQIYDLGNRLDHMESVLGKNHADVLRLKRYYSLLQIRQWLFESRVVEECSETRLPILYFYDNTAGVCDRCDEQGFVLTYLRRKHDFLSVYSFDMNAQTESLKSLMARYGVTSAPTIVIAGEVLEGFYGQEPLENIILDVYER